MVRRGARAETIETPRKRGGKGVAKERDDDTDRGG